MFKKLGVSWFLFFLLPCAAWCVDVTPSYQILEIKQGASVAGEVSITNTEREPIHVTPFTKNWFMLPAYKKMKVEEWLTTDEKPFDLKPGESRMVHFTARAPKKVEGELVGMMSLRTRTPTQGAIELMMSVAVYVAVSGTEKMDGQIMAFSLEQSSHSVQASVLVQNTGNIHLRPKGTLQVFDDKSELVATFYLGNGQPIFPGTPVALSKVLNDFHLEPGHYKAEVKLTDTDRQPFSINVRKKFVVNQDGKAELK